MGHKNIVSLSDCLEQLYSCIFSSYVKAYLNIWWRHMYGLKLFCLLPVIVCIDAYMLIDSACQLINYMLAPEENVCNIPV